MALTARASATVRSKNLIILVMCFGSMAWFGYDGWKGYPGGNDRRVDKLKSDSSELLSADQEFVRAWKLWANESHENHVRMDGLIEQMKTKVEGLNGWKTTSEIALQRYIVYGLGCAAAAALWWFFHCQRRRVIADDKTISPKVGAVIPWEKITKVDNTRWKKMGIVDLTYTDETGQSAKAKLDDYETDRDPLLEILDLLAEKAVNAEFVPKEEPVAANAAESAK